MKILIAGGAGYIGTSLTPALSNRGYYVTVVDNLMFGNYLPAPRLVDVKDVFDLRQEDLREFDQVIFLAGLSNDPMADFDPIRNFIQNAAAPAYLAHIAKKAGVRRYIYASSCAVYGFTGDYESTENDAASSDYAYGQSKLQGEQAVLGLSDRQFSVIALRKGTVSGYSPRMRLDLMVNTMFASAITTGAVIVNNPSIWRPILSIQDAVQAYTRAVEAHAQVSGVFNIASGNYTVGAVADIVAESFSSDIIIKDIPDKRNYRVSVTKAQKTLGFVPSGTVKSIVLDLLEHKARFQDMDNPRYKNIEIFRQRR